MSYVLFLSNGYGEDTIACGIIRHLLTASPTEEIRAMPLVGEGLAYRQAAISMVGPQELMPSGGMIPAGVNHLMADLKAGLIRLTVQQIQALRGGRGSVARVVAVGDTYPVLLGALFSRGPVTFVGTAKSNYFVPYARAEAAIFRRYCDAVFARDEPTARSLAADGVPARWVGNTMMDCIDGYAVDLHLPPDRPAIGVLPGSRRATYQDLPILLDAIQLLGPAYSFAVVLADSIDLLLLGKVASSRGWTLSTEEPADLVAALVKGNVRIHLAKRALGSLFESCRLILGQAGTANEQAVGAGLPVVAFESSGRKRLGWYRGRQKGLLGDSLRVVAREAPAIADAARRILEDPSAYEAMRRIGRERMGPPGASRKIAEWLLETPGTVNGRGEFYELSTSQGEP